MENLDESEELKQIHREMEETFLEYYEDYKRYPSEMLSYSKNQSGIIVAYETLIHFLVREDYEKCAYMRQLIGKYHEERLPIAKILSIFNK